MRLSRRNPEINDVVEVLAECLREASKLDDKNAVRRAWDSLQPDEFAAIEKEISLCLADRRYYLENYHVITDEQGQLKTLYPFWTHQEIIYAALEEEWQKRGRARLIILKPRQCGGTVWSAGIIFHRTIFLPQAYNMMMSNNADNVAIIDQRMQTAYDNLPWWLRPEILSRQAERQWVFDRFNPEQRNIDPGLGSTLLISNAQKMAGVAIGKTIRSIHMSEVSRYPEANIYTSDIKPSLNARDTLAIMESTAFGRRGLFYNQWKAAEAGKSEWVPVFIPVYRVTKYFLPLSKGEKLLLTEEERGIRDNVKETENFSVPLGFFKWRRQDIVETINSTGSDEDHHEAYPLNWGEAFISSGFGAFPKKCLNEQENKYVRPPLSIGEIRYTSLDVQPKLMNFHPPVHGETMEKPTHINRLWVWETPDANETIQYYIGADVSSGEADDYSAATVYRIGIAGEPDTQVASWHGLINPAEYARTLAALGIWYHGAEIAVEYTGFGITTGDELYRTIDYPNIYRWKRLDHLNSLTTLVHWMTTSKTRPDAISRMCEALLDNSVVLRDKHLIEEMRDFARYENTTKIEGIDNNDDMVMSALIGLTALRQNTRMSGDWGSLTSSVSRLISTLPQVFGLYDEFSRQIGQFEGLKKAEDFVQKMEEKYRVQKGQLGLKIVPIQVMKANTPYSPIYDGQGAENELYCQGMRDRHITPDIVQIYREIMTRQHYEGDQE